jgi:hypothetical protein
METLTVFSSTTRSSPFLGLGVSGSAYLLPLCEAQVGRNGPTRRKGRIARGPLALAPPRPEAGFQGHCSSITIYVQNHSVNSTHLAAVFEHVARSSYVHCDRTKNQIDRSTSQPLPAEFGHLVGREKRGMAEERFWAGSGNGRTPDRIAGI